MVEVECPCGGCDYSGPVQSVEAHISGSTRGEHSGHAGREFREILIERAEAVANGVEEAAGDLAEGAEAALVGTGGRSDEGGAEAPKLSEAERAVEPNLTDSGTGSEGVVPATSIMAAPLALGGLFTGAGSDDGPNWTLIVGVGLAAVLLYLMLAEGGSEGSVPEVETEADSDDGSGSEDTEGEGGLV